MNQVQDYADNEVKGLERYFPTRLSRALLVTLLTAPVGTFWIIIQNSTQLMSGYEPFVQNLISGFIALTLAIVILLAMIVDLTIVANHSKHSRIRHLSYQHPQMSFKWLWQNIETKHCIFLLTVFTLGVICGSSL